MIIPPICQKNVRTWKKRKKKVDGEEKEKEKEAVVRVRPILFSSVALIENLKLIPNSAYVKNSSQSFIYSKYVFLLTPRHSL